MKLTSNHFLMPLHKFLALGLLFFLAQFTCYSNSDQLVMIPVRGGILPQGSQLANQTVDFFHIARYETNWAEWKQVRSWAASNGYDIADVGEGSEDDHPVRSLNWYDAIKWCNAKSEMEGLVPVYSNNGTTFREGDVAFPLRNSEANGYRLPTDAEWEWAARGGVKEVGNYTYSGSDNLSSVGWYYANSSGAAVNLYDGKGTWPIAEKLPNALGLYDMSGNVWEWCEDLLPHPQAPYHRSIRGGSWASGRVGVGSGEDECSVSSRGGLYPWSRYLDMSTGDSSHGSSGFRYARSVEAPDFVEMERTYIGNFATPDIENPDDALLRNGQVLITLHTTGSFSGALFFNGRKAGFRSRFDADGNWSGVVTVASRLVEMEMLLEGGELGNRVSCSIMFNSEESTTCVLLPVAYTGSSGEAFEWSGDRLNVVFENTGVSDQSFGFGYAGVSCAKNGIMRFAGKLADNTSWTGAARVVRDETGDMSIPLAVRLSNGLLHGEAGVELNPDEGEYHLFSMGSWLWTREPNPKTKSFVSGFVEEINGSGRLWAWTKGTSALGGNTANFTLTLSAPSGASLSTGADRLTGNLSASNRVRWSQSPPKGFSMKITPSTGLVSGKVPATQDGKDVMLPYQGILFSENLDLGSGGSARGAGFVAGDGVSNQMAITLE
jgi:formylglycine-generating enzyme required for sulfatase activity